MLTLFELVGALVYPLILYGSYSAYKRKKLDKYTLSVILALLLSNLIKIALKVPRPDPAFKGYSFPSNHASASFAVSYYIGIYGYILAIVISLSRILIGAHRLVDIIFGAFLGVYVAYTIDRTKFYLNLVMRKIVSVLVLLLYLFLSTSLEAYAVVILLSFLILIFPYITGKGFLKEVKEKLAYHWESKFYPEGVLTLLISLLFISFFDFQFRIALSMVVILSDLVSFFGNDSKLRVNKKPILGSILGSILTFIIISNFFNPMTGLISSIAFFLSSLMIYDNAFIGILVSLATFLSLTLLG